MYGLNRFIYCHILVGFLLSIPGTILIGIGSHYIGQECDECSISITDNITTIKYNDISQILDINYLNNQTVNCRYSNEQIQIIDDCNQVMGIILLAIGIPLSLIGMIVYIIVSL